MSTSQFKKGTKVEISSDEEGFAGAWFTGKVITPPTKTTKKVTVEYDTLLADDGLKPLREKVDLSQIRPIPPRESSKVFKLDDVVDAFYNDGWWEGVVTQVGYGDSYDVFFRPTKEQAEFKGIDLRVHREWDGQDWLPPLEEEELGCAPPPTPVPRQGQSGYYSGVMQLMNLQSNGEAHPTKLETQEAQPKRIKTQKAQPTEMDTLSEIDNPLRKGSHVEVSSDEDGFQGAWFGANVIEVLEKGKFLIEYKDLMNEDNTGFVREEVDSLHIRPCPPKGEKVDKFTLYDEVDALYQDGWWVGIISKVMARSKYEVYFKNTEEKMVFTHDQIRMHQEWTNGKWMMASEAINLTE